MRFTEYDLFYLTGEKFVTTYDLSCDWDAQDKTLITRQEYLSQLVNAKKIIHVGCVDHDIDTINKKIEKQEWLHALLCESAETCLGIDINQTGIDYIKDNLGFPLVEKLDIGEENSTIISQHNWDAMVLAEIVEHFDNPVAFLSKIRERYKPNVSSIIVTVPNALALKNYSHAKRHIERINSDHRFWFTPYTIAKILVQAGFEIDQLRLCVRKKPKNRFFGKQWKLKTYPLLRNGIVVTAKL